MAKGNTHPVQCRAMRAAWPALGLLILAAALAGCGAVEKQWMKVSEPYTTAEFRRDYAECSKKSGDLDEDCMRARGWVEMKQSRGDRAADNPATPPPQPSQVPRQTRPR